MSTPSALDQSAIQWQRNRACTLLHAFTGSAGTIRRLWRIRTTASLKKKQNQRDFSFREIQILALLTALNNPIRRHLL